MPYNTGCEKTSQSYFNKNRKIVVRKYKFCVFKDANNLEPVISSITIERLRRAGEKIKTDLDVKI